MHMTRLGMHRMVTGAAKFPEDASCGVMLQQLHVGLGTCTLANAACLHVVHGTLEWSCSRVERSTGSRLTVPGRQETLCNLCTFSCGAYVFGVSTCSTILLGDYRLGSRVQLNAHPTVLR